MEESPLFARTAEDGNPHGDPGGPEVLLPHPAHLQSPKHNFSHSSVSARLALTACMASHRAVLLLTRLEVTRTRSFPCPVSTAGSQGTSWVSLARIYRQATPAPHLHSVLRAARARRSRRGDCISLRECRAQGQLFASSTGPRRAREHRSQHMGSGKGTARQSRSKPSIAPAARPAVPGWC